MYHLCKTVAEMLSFLLLWKITIVKIHKTYCEKSQDPIVKKHNTPLS